MFFHDHCESRSLLNSSRTNNTSTHVCSAELDSAIQARVEDIAIRAHCALGCRYYSCADMLVRDSGEIALLEVNTLPGMTEASLYPEAARAASIPFDELMKHLFELAMVDGYRANRKSASPDTLRVNSYSPPPN